ncbi:MAG: hypothetical protein II008_18195 [Oscillospiraceae bacterium]|nr:hypothetical protein [Oscillospiraceae bacterium]
MDIRLKTLPFVFEGRTYQLRCNMNVLADVQEANGGRIDTALSGQRGLRNALMFLAAMMTDYADEQGWTDNEGRPLSFTWRGLGRALRVEDVPMAKIIAMVLDALTPPKTAESGENNGAPEKEAPGN